MASDVFNFSSDILSKAYSAHLLCPFLWVSHSPWAAACSLLSSVWSLCLDLWLLICCLGGLELCQSVRMVLVVLLLWVCL